MCMGAKGGGETGRCWCWKGCREERGKRKEEDHTLSPLGVRTSDQVNVSVCVVVIEALKRFCMSCITCHARDDVFVTMARMRVPSITSRERAGAYWENSERRWPRPIHQAAHLMTSLCFCGIVQGERAALASMQRPHAFPPCLGMQPFTYTVIPSMGLLNL